MDDNEVLSSKTATPANTSQNNGARNKKPTMSGYFDGKTFLIRKHNGDIIHRERESYPAVAGTPDWRGNFDYSRKRQATRDEGPLPEGSYWINPQKIEKSPKRLSKDDILNRGAAIYNAIFGDSFGKVGSMPGGHPSWGEGHVALNPHKVIIDGVERCGFTIHGGDCPGTLGCIDLMKNDKRFFEFLEKHREDMDSVPIFVNYSGDFEKYK